MRGNAGGDRNSDARKLERASRPAQQRPVARPGSPANNASPKRPNPAGGGGGRWLLIAARQSAAGRVEANIIAGGRWRGRSEQ